jgi:cytochrome c oxidase subunit 2
MDQPMQCFRRFAARFSITAAALAATLTASISAARAQVPQNWQMGMQTPHSPVAEGIQSLHDIVLWIITLITLFVLGLLLYAVWRFDAKRNPTPSQFSHNTFIEIAWTLIPVLILVGIAIPSFRLVYFEDRTPNADMTIKVTGHQWYWEYTYPDNDNIDFQSYVVKDDDLKPGQLRLLDVDNPLVLPVGKNIRILTTSADVIHSFFIPSLGVQRYAIPGRTIETWVRIDAPNTFYGQCNQICGANHSAMPIKIQGVPEAEFVAWLADAKKKFASDLPSVPATTAVAQAAIAQVQH